MGRFCGAFPILSGKAQAARELAKTLKSTRWNEFDASQKRSGTTRECWFYQPSPQGDLMVVYFEAADIQKAFDDFGRSQEPYDLWFKNQIKEITGVDLSQPTQGPPPEELLTYGY